MNDTTDLFQAMRMWHRGRMFSRSPDDGLAAAFWCGCVSEHRLPVLASDKWTTKLGGPSLVEIVGGRVLFTVLQGGSAGEIVVDLDGAVVHLHRDRRSEIRVTVAARSSEGVAAVVAHVRRMLPVEKPSGVRAPVTFWTYSNGADHRTETLDLARWDDISLNYPTRTREQVDPLMRGAGLAGGGKLLLWLGPPGTGKTYALRALAWEHREHVALHYIIDPEKFFAHADYASDVFFGEEKARHDDSDEDEESNQRTRLIVLEDAGEFLGADASSVAGAGLARLLNATDGLAGQGTRTKVLITTNEDVGRLHPAVTRPGRCSALVRFSPFDEAEAVAWLRARGRADAVRSGKSSPSLAELFATLRGEDVALPDAPSVGFRPRHER